MSQLFSLRAGYTLVSSNVSGPTGSLSTLSEEISDGASGVLYGSALVDSTGAIKSKVTLYGECNGVMAAQGVITVDVGVSPLIECGGGGSSIDIS